jgi:hypothetical protein
MKDFDDIKMHCTTIKIRVVEVNFTVLQPLPYGGKKVVHLT